MPSTGRRKLVDAEEEALDINADPLSSSEEDDSQNRKSSAARESLQSSVTKSSLDKDSTMAGKSRRTGPPRIKDTPAAPSENTATSRRPPPQSNSSLHFFDTLDGFASQQPQKRRKKNPTYGSRTSAPSASAPELRTLNIPNLPCSFEKPPALSGFNDVVPIKNLDLHTLDFPTHKLDTRSLPTPLELNAVVPRLKLPAEISCEPASSSTSGTTSSQTFSLPEELPEVKARGRSGSTSSLSSVDSGASLVMTQGEKLALMEVDSPGSQAMARCPLCNFRVQRRHLEDFSGGRQMGIRAQQRFCREHKERDAKSMVDGRGYPKIDWDDLKSRRVQDHIPFLMNILQRRQSSYYLSKLEDVALKSNQRKLQHYLKQSTVDLVKNGYYGPKGATILSSGISTMMSNSLSEALRNDKVVKATDVGGFVSAVLLPELLVRLVLEDMKISNEDDARRILDESTELGILLNGDD